MAIFIHYRMAYLNSSIVSFLDGLAADGHHLPAENFPQHVLHAADLVLKIRRRVYFIDVVLVVLLVSHRFLHPQRYYLRELVVLIHIFIVRLQSLIRMNQQLVPILQFLDEL